MTDDLYTMGPWWVDPIDDPERFNLPRGTIYQILAMVDGTPATICTVEEYREIARPLNRAADAALLSASTDLLECLIALADPNSGEPEHQAAMRAIIKATSPYEKPGASDQS
jgi:hypothetical protein